MTPGSAETPAPAEVTAAIRERLARCAPGATACPSEVARALYTGAGDGWRELLDPVRQAAKTLAAQGELEFTQRGEVVDPDTARGPVRLRPAG